MQTGVVDTGILSEFVSKLPSYLNTAEKSLNFCHVTVSQSWILNYAEKLFVFAKCYHNRRFIL